MGMKCTVTVLSSVWFGVLRGGMHMFVSILMVWDSTFDCGMCCGFITVRFCELWMYVSSPPPWAFILSVRTGV